MSPPAEHVAVHEDGPACVAHQMGHQEAGEGEGRALLRIAGTAVLLAQLFGHDRGDRQRQAAVLIQAVDQHVGGDPLTRVVTDEDGDRSAHR